MHLLKLEISRQDETFVRRGFHEDGKAVERGNIGLSRVYQHNRPAIDERLLRAGLHDIRAQASDKTCQDTESTFQNGSAMRLPTEVF